MSLYLRHLLLVYGWEAILLFLLGLILLAIETFILVLVAGNYGLVCLVISITWLHLVGKQV